MPDANGDGAPDLFATGFLQPPQLWINRNPSHAKTLVVSLRGDPSAPGPHRSTRDALGAAVTVDASGISRTQFVSAGYSFLSSGSRELYFGLGDAEARRPGRRALAVGARLGEAAGAGRPARARGEGSLTARRTY